MKTIIYIRTSTEEQNPENQLKDCLSLLKSNKEYELIEEKQSAWREHIEREGFSNLKKQIKSKNVKTLIVWDLDRIYRNRKSLIEFFTFCKIYGCKVDSFRQQWLNQLNEIPEPFNEMMFNLMLQIMGWLAEEESNKKSERIKNAIRMKKDGAYSYKGNKWGRKEISTIAIKKIMELQKEGLSMREIAKRVTYSDKSNNKKNVSPSLVHKILSGQHRKTKVKGVCS